MPRMPETLIINVSDMGGKVGGRAVAVGRQGVEGGQGERRRTERLPPTYTSMGNAAGSGNALMNASTTAGSNWVPEQVRSSV